MAADSKPSKAPAGIYATAAQMAMSGGASKPGTAAGNTGEKVKNIQTLLEVFKKMDTIEDDPAAKDMIKQMSDTAEKYLQKVQGGTGPGADADKPAAMPSTDTTAPAAGGAAGGAAGMSDTAMPVPA